MKPDVSRKSFALRPEIRAAKSGPIGTPPTKPFPTYPEGLDRGRGAREGSLASALQVARAVLRQLGVLRPLVSESSPPWPGAVCPSPGMRGPPACGWWEAERVCRAGP